MAESTKIHVGVGGLHSDLAKTGIPSICQLLQQKGFSMSVVSLADSYQIFCVFLTPACSAQNMGPKAVGVLVIRVSKRGDD